MKKKKKHTQTGNYRSGEGKKIQSEPRTPCCCLFQDCKAVFKSPKELCQKGSA